MPILLRLFLLVLASAAILGARHASRQSQARFGWPASPALRPVAPAGPVAGGELTSTLRARQ